VPRPTSSNNSTSEIRFVRSDVRSAVSRKEINFLARSPKTLDAETAESSQQNR